MSASEPDKAILLTDEPNVVKKKINKHAFFRWQRGQLKSIGRREEIAVLMFRISGCIVCLRKMMLRLRKLRRVMKAGRCYQGR